MLEESNNALHKGPLERPLLNISLRTRPEVRWAECKPHRQINVERLRGIPKSLELLGD